MNPDCFPGPAVVAGDPIPRQVRVPPAAVEYDRAGIGSDAAPGSGRPSATVDLAAIGHNLQIARSRTDRVIMAVVKADGFGHGAVPVARAAVAGGAQWLGVATPAEALELRTAGITAPILAWLYGPGLALGRLVAENVDVAVATPGQLDAVVHAATVAGRPAAVHLKVDTGLSRGGCTLEGWAELTALARRWERAGLVEVRALWTHFVDADADEPALLRTQLALFDAAAGVPAPSNSDTNAPP